MLKYCNHIKYACFIIAINSALVALFERILACSWCWWYWWEGTKWNLAETWVKELIADFPEQSSDCW